MVSKKFKIELFGKYDTAPIHWDWSNEVDGVRKLDIKFTKRRKIKNAYYCYVTVTRNTANECYDEFDGQLSDGFFENVPDDNLGEIWEVIKK